MLELSSIYANSSGGKVELLGNATKDEEIFDCQGNILSLFSIMKDTIGFEQKNKAHNDLPIIRERIKICGMWSGVMLMKGIRKF